MNANLLGTHVLDYIEGITAGRGVLYGIAVLGLDCDNDSSFINELLFGYCKINSIQFTRSRPYKKNDNAHIEQKNNTHVRQVLGYVRYDTQVAVNAINNLYRNELRIYQNYFQPSVKLIKKIRVGSKVKKIYDDPQTPYQRLLNSNRTNMIKLQDFKEQAQAWDPFELSEVIEEKLAHIYKLASRTPRKWLPIPPSYRDPLTLPTPWVPNSCLPREQYLTSPVREYRRIYRKEKFQQTWG